MAIRGKNKKTSQPEKLLTILLSGREITLEEINKTLGKEIELYRLSTYLYDLKMMGAQIEKKKLKRKMVGFRLINVDEMSKYMSDRKAVVEKSLQKKLDKLEAKSDIVLTEHETVIAPVVGEDVADPEEAPPVPMFSDPMSDSHLANF